MEKFGLIGKTLKHSYSSKIHATMGGYSYSLVEISENDLEKFVLSKEYKGYNVTIPYKEKIIPYLDKVDDSAKNIGAVNTVVNKNGKLIGYNTDLFGMEYSLARAGIDLKDKAVLILGSGGTSKTATALCNKLKAKKILILSRNGNINYDNYAENKDVQVIINTTPIGMYPNNYDCKIDLNAFPLLEGVFDAVYNPNLTYLTYLAKKKGIKYSNGLPMLVAQAKGTMELFLDTKVDDLAIEKTLNQLEKQTLNIVLIGMSGCGKSTVSKLIAKELNREALDTDAIIEQRENTDIPTIFKQKGEKYFRDLEKSVIKEVGTLTGKVIATGGGAVLNSDNYFSLKQNSIIVYLKRGVEKLSTKGRPLSTDLTAVKNLFEKRKQKYLDFADIIVDNDGELQETVKEILLSYENFSN